MQKKQRQRQAKVTVSKRRQERQAELEAAKALLAAEEAAAEELKAADLLTRVARGRVGRKKARDTKVAPQILYEF